MHFSTATLALASSLVGLSAAAPFGGFGGFGGFDGGYYGQSGSSGQSASSPQPSSSSGQQASSSGQQASSSGQSSSGSVGQLSANVLCKGCEQTGIGGNGSEAGEVPSLTSKENFINFCVGQDNGPKNLPITNGIQITSGSCNPVPMGAIAATTNMPSSKFVHPKNLDTVPANQNFTVQMAIANLQTGAFVNADTNYYSAPCFLNEQGDIVGHSHIVIQEIDSLQSTSLTDNTKFAFFKGLDDAAQNGILSVTVSPGLKPGTYRMGSINTCANHQPALVAVAQHANLDDIIYFEVKDGGSASGSSGSSGQSSGSGSSSAGQSSGSGSSGQSSSGSSSSGSSSSSSGSSSSGSSSSSGKGTGKSASSTGGSTSGFGSGSSSSGSSSSGSKKCNAKRLAKRRMELERRATSFSA